MKIPACNSGVTNRIIFYGCDHSFFKNRKDYYKTFLYCLARYLELTPINDGFCYSEIPVPDSDFIGISSCQIIMESHIAIHTWPETNSIRLVIDSCKNFKPEDVVNFCEHDFKFTEYESKFF